MLRKNNDTKEQSDQKEQNKNEAASLIGAILIVYFNMIYIVAKQFQEAQKAQNTPDPEHIHRENIKKREEIIKAKRESMERHTLSILRTEVFKSHLMAMMSDSFVSGLFFWRLPSESSPSKPTLTANQKSILNRLKTEQPLTLDQRKSLREVEEKSPYVDHPGTSKRNLKLRRNPYSDMWKESPEPKQREDVFLDHNGPQRRIGK